MSSGIEVVHAAASRRSGRRGLGDPGTSTPGNAKRAAVKTVAAKFCPNSENSSTPLAGSTIAAENLDPRLGLALFRKRAHEQVVHVHARRASMNTSWINAHARRAMMPAHARIVQHGPTAGEVAKWTVSPPATATGVLMKPLAALPNIVKSFSTFTKRTFFPAETWA